MPNRQRVRIHGGALSPGLQSPITVVRILELSFIEAFENFEGIFRGVKKKKKKHVFISFSSKHAK